MKTRVLFSSLAIIAALVSVGCSTTVSRPGQLAQKEAVQRSIDVNVDSALTKLYANEPQSKEIIGEAKGVLVFPSVFSIGFVLGSSQGQGALRINGSTSQYYETNGLKVGWLAGAKSEAVFLVFMTQESLDEFRASKGWTAGVDASVTFAKIGANSSLSTDNARQSIVGYALTNKGVMANASLDGTKISKLNL